MSTFAEAGVRPYRGPKYYRAEHRHLFFGRTPDIHSVVELAFEQRLSVLHAVSGAGKTSLLSAGVMPDVEGRGWIAVRSRPSNDPVAALKEETLRRTLPEVALEVGAIDDLAGVLERHDGPRDGTLVDIKQWVSVVLRKSSEDYQRVLSPFPRSTVSTNGGGASGEEVTPFFVRFLQTERGPWLLARHLKALDSLAKHRRWPDLSVPQLANELATMRLSDVREFFAASDVAPLASDLRAFVDRPDIPLNTFFERLVRIWGFRADPFGILLILDQFEELFTRFVDQRHQAEEADTTLPSWELRPQYFGQLAALLETRHSGTDEHPSGPLPVRILISMRDDHIARLDELEALTGTVGHNARIHLTLLRTADLSEVVCRPAALFQVTYEPELLRRLESELPKEEDRIEPGHVQIICERLWEEVGARLAAQPSGGVIEIGELDGPHVGGVKGILEQHFQRIVRGRGDTFEILDILEPLITQSGRRNIVERRILIDAPFRRAAHREKLLEYLREERIVQVETRIRNEFVEITHEFLIPAVSQEIAATLIEEPRWRDLESAISALQRLARGELRHLHARLLTSHEIAALNWYWQHLDTEGHPWIAEAVFRSAVALQAPPGDIRRYAKVLDDTGLGLDGVSLLREVAERRLAARRLDAFELRAILATRAVDTLAAPDRVFILECALMLGDAGIEELIATIARSLIDESKRS